MVETGLDRPVAHAEPRTGGRPIPFAMTVDDRVPVERYFDPAFAELERRHLWPRTWQMACRLEEIPEPGDYTEYAIADQSVLVVWEVLGHLDLLLDAGAVSEEVRDDGSRYGKAWFSLREPVPDLRHLGTSNGYVREPITSVVLEPIIHNPRGPRSAETN